MASLTPNRDGAQATAAALRASNPHAAPPVHAVDPLARLMASGAHDRLDGHDARLDALEAHGAAAPDAADDEAEDAADHPDHDEAA